MKDSRVCKDLHGEAGHGVLAKSAKNDLAPSLAGPLDNEPANDHQNKAYRQQSQMYVHR
jgi:hypothetical protein